MTACTEPNRLAQESSLYLRQHAYNPVDWYPWGPEALAKAAAEQKPIFLSIGYSACHWCHVMEHESFEDEATAAQMNEQFVNIKVDREERPDLDAIYMHAVQLLNQGQGGWPMSVWLTPEMQPFYAGTYYPPKDSYGRPSFRRLLTALNDAWRDRRDEVLASAGQITQAVQQFGEQLEGQMPRDEQLLRHAADALRRSFDPIHGGFGSQPKFPHALELRLLLRVAERFGDANALQMALKTLVGMARGGMYDQLGGGFHRYSVDARWLVPHFEKMLYDNALLAVAYTEAHQLTGEPFYRQIAEETLDYVLREMTSPHGGFYSTQDADSEGEEGKFFVWSLAEIRSALDSDAAQLIETVYGVSEAGNFEGHNILFRSRSDAEDARRAGLSLDEFRTRLHAAKQTLWQLREQRIKPGRDEKILAAWNGMMIAAFAKAGLAFDRLDYTAAAVRAASFVCERLAQPDGRLYRTASDDAPAKLNGYSEDYAFLIEAFTDLFEATGDGRWLSQAERWAELLERDFHDRAGGGFYSTGVGHEALVARLKDVHDGSTPSGNSMAAMGLLRLGCLTGNTRWSELAERTLQTYQGMMERNPAAAGQMLVAYDLWLGPREECVLMATAENDELQAARAVAAKPFAPRRFVVALTPERAAAAPEWLRLLPADDAVALYRCSNFACAQPVVGLEAIRTALALSPGGHSSQTSAITSSET